MLRGKKRVGLAVGCLAAVVAGCGTAQVFTGSPSQLAPTTPAAVAYHGSSTHYCQLLGDGAWVTDVARSTTPCVPDPSYATGDERVDGAVAVPRCFKCKLADWKQAEKQAAAAQVAAVTQTTEDQPTNHWPGSVRRDFISSCGTAGMGKEQCGCMANHLDRQIPVAQMGDEAADDQKIQTAETECAAATAP
jgi:hypothetical protein